MKPKKIPPAVPPPQDCRGKIGAILTVYNAMGSRHSTSRRNIWCLSKVFPQPSFILANV